jgi:hypothetical protein
MTLQRYDVRDARGMFVERHWRPSNTPIFAENGQLLYVLHQVQEVTDEVLAARDPGKGAAYSGA